MLLLQEHYWVCQATFLQRDMVSPVHTADNSKGLFHLLTLLKYFPLCSLLCMVPSWTTLVSPGLSLSLFVSGSHGGVSKGTSGQTMLGLNTRKQEAALATQRNHVLISHSKQWLVYWDFLSLLMRGGNSYSPHTLGEGGQGCRLTSQ